MPGLQDSEMVVAGYHQNHFMVSLIFGFRHYKTFTSSAAQGSGGSFKDRKPIGGWLLQMMERKANPLMDRKVVGGSAMWLKL